MTIARMMHEGLEEIAAVDIPQEEGTERQHRRRMKEVLIKVRRIATSTLTKVDRFLIDEGALRYGLVEPRSDDPTKPKIDPKKDHFPGKKSPHVGGLF